MDLIERGDGSRFRHPWELARLRFVSRLIRKYSARPDPLMLDIGCGDGYFIREMAGKYPGGRFVGLDIALSDSELDAMNSVAETNVRFTNKSLEAGRMMPRPADVVFLMDVIEHVEDDVSLVRDAATSPIGSSDTLIVITVPAFGSLFTSHDVHLKHFRRYTLSQLSRTIELAGCRAITVGYFFTSLLVPRLLSKLKERVAGESEDFGIGGWPHGRVVTRAIGSALYSDAMLGLLLSRAAVNVPGLSAYAVCRPS